MPYIKEAARKQINSYRPPRDAGELNYEITRCCLRYLESRGQVNYAHLNEVIGVLESAKLEFYRRAAAHYEDAKIQQNGDVYPAIGI